MPITPSHAHTPLFCSPARLLRDSHDCCDGCPWHVVHGRIRNDPPGCTTSLLSCPEHHGWSVRVIASLIKAINGGHPQTLAVRTFAANRSKPEAAKPARSSSAKHAANRPDVKAEAAHGGACTSRAPPCQHPARFPTSAVVRNLMGTRRPSRSWVSAISGLATLRGQSARRSSRLAARTAMLQGRSEMTRRSTRHPTSCKAW